MAVNVRIHAVHALKHVADGRAKGFGEGDAGAGGEDGFVVDLGLEPGHEVVDVVGSGHFGGLGVGVVVLPEVFVFVRGFHGGAGGGGTEFGDGAVLDVC